MTKLAAILAIIALGLLLVSLAPWPAAAQEVAGPPEELNLEVRPEARLSEASRGQALFLSKGCATCHRHDGVGGRSGQIAIGPDLSDYRPDPAFVRRWLRDPAAIRPGTQMPNLALDEAEIEALVAFLAGAKEKAADAATASQGCPVSQPADPAFIPPDPALSKEDELLKAPTLGSFDGHFWFGSDSLWTQLPLDGRWAELPRNERARNERDFTQKIFFGRQGYNWREEPLPALTVSGRRLDESGLAFEELEATNGFHPEVGSFMLVGVDIPTAGCWQITGNYEGHELSFVVLVVE